jgi:hypothetical protein
VDSVSAPTEAPPAPPTSSPPSAAAAPATPESAFDRAFREARLGLYPIVTSQYSSTTLYQVSCHIR